MAQIVLPIEVNNDAAAGQMVVGNGYGGLKTRTFYANQLFASSAADGMLTVYISPSGVDTNNGLTPESPVKTVQKAVNLYINRNALRLYFMAGSHTSTATWMTPAIPILHITGAGVDQTTLLRGLAFGIDDFCEYYDTAFHVYISDVTITSGDDYPCIMVNRPATLSIDNVAFTSIYNGCPYGMWIYDGTVYLNNVQFQRLYAGMSIDRGRVFARDTTITSVSNFGVIINTGVFLCSGGSNAAKTPTYFYGDSYLYGWA
jgi:hypothetical protein